MAGTELQLTTKAQEAVSAAVRDAAAQGHPHTEPAHLLRALAQQTETTTAAAAHARRHLGGRHHHAAPTRCSPTWRR